MQSISKTFQNMFKSLLCIRNKPSLLCTFGRFVFLTLMAEEALASFCISLPSGQSTTISLPASSTVAALKEAAQEAFQQGWLRLATADGRLILDSQQQKWMKSCCCPFLCKQANTLLLLSICCGCSAWPSQFCNGL